MNELKELFQDTIRNLEDIIDLIKSSSTPYKDRYLNILESDLVDLHFIKNHIELNELVVNTEKKENCI